jgi:hypothetical protein
VTLLQVLQNLLRVQFLHVVESSQKPDLQLVHAVGAVHSVHVYEQAVHVGLVAVVR